MKTVRWQVLLSRKQTATSTLWFAPRIRQPLQDFRPVWSALVLYFLTSVLKHPPCKYIGILYPIQLFVYYARTKEKRLSKTMNSTEDSEDDLFRLCWKQQNCGGCLDQSLCSWCPVVS